MPGIGIVYNRNAGKHNRFRKQLDERLVSLLGDSGVLRESSSIDQIDQVAKEFLDKNIDILGICGGDGSNHYVLSSFIRLYGTRQLPKVALLCSGTHNAHADSIGIRGNPTKILDNIVHKHNHREQFEIIHRNIMQINDGETIRYGFTMATGFMQRFMEDLNVTHQGDSVAKTAQRLLSWIGSWMVNGNKIRKVFELQPARVIVDNHRLEWEKINGISISAMERLGLGFTPYPRAGEKLGYFAMSVLRVSPNTFLRLMWDYKRSKIPTHPDQINGLCASIIQEAQTPLAYVLDGEIYKGSPRLEVTAGPVIDIIAR
jgi:diacylglycerol kinase family enzyme